MQHYDGDIRFETFYIVTRRLQQVDQSCKFSGHEDHNGCTLGDVHQISDTITTDSASYFESVDFKNAKCVASHTTAVCPRFKKASETSSGFTESDPASRLAVCLAVQSFSLWFSRNQDSNVSYIGSLFFAALDL